MGRKIARDKRGTVLKRSNTLNAVTNTQCESSYAQFGRGFLLLVLLFAAVLAFSFAALAANSAYGVPDDTTEMTADEDDSEVDADSDSDPDSDSDSDSDSASASSASSSSAASTGLYGDEKIKVDVLADKLKAAETSNLIASVEASSMKMRADAIAARIPEQQERSDKAAQNLYKIQQSRYGIVEMLLSAQTIDEFINNVDYLHDVTQSNVNEIKVANEMKAEAEQAQAGFDQVRAEAAAKVKKVRGQLEAEQAKRIAKAEDGIATAKEQAVSYRAASRRTTKKNGKKTTIVSRVEATDDTSSLADGADWSQTKEEFVEEWAPRIDDYLEGSPLEGQGENFAKSAWKYCIDPRWSPAISNTESSKGAHCIRPHNAWGWGAADSNPYGLAAEWKSWEEAIDAHAKGLSNGYGYTITKSGAATYCPYTWESWYNRTLSEMASI